MKKENTTIRVKKSTKNRLKKLGRKGDSYDDIILDLLERVNVEDKFE